MLLFVFLLLLALDFFVFLEKNSVVAFELLWSADADMVVGNNNPKPNTPVNSSFFMMIILIVLHFKNMSINFRSVTENRKRRIFNKKTFQSF